MLVVRGVARCGYHMVSQYCWGMVYHGIPILWQNISSRTSARTRRREVDHQSTLIWATVLDIAGHSGCRIQQNGHPQLELVGSSKRANPQSRIKDGERAGVNHNSHRFSEVRYSIARHLGMSLHFLSNRSWEITWGEAPAMLWEWGVQAVKKIGILKCKWLYYIM